MDENDFIPEAYILEVSSPGLGRQLKKEKDFKRSIGKNVMITVAKNPCRQEWQGSIHKRDHRYIKGIHKGKDNVRNRFCKRV